MPRPKKMRSVRRPPLFANFKPVGVLASNLLTTELALDEYEAIRLVEKARQKTARFVITGQRLRIDGGDITVAKEGEIMFGRNRRGMGCGHTMIREELLNQHKQTGE